MPAPPPAEQSGSPEDLVRVLRAEGIGDRRILAAFRAVPRAEFVPPAAAGQAYVDAPIRIPHGQVTSQPSLIASMVAALELGYESLMACRSILFRILQLAEDEGAITATPLRRVPPPGRRVDPEIVLGQAKRRAYSQRRRTWLAQVRSRRPRISIASSRDRGRLLR